MVTKIPKSHKFGIFRTIAQGNVFVSSLTTTDLDHERRLPDGTLVYDILSTHRTHEEAHMVYAEHQPTIVAFFKGFDKNRMERT